MSRERDADDFMRLAKRARNWQAMILSPLAEDWEPGALRARALEDLNDLVTRMLYPPPPPAAALESAAEPAPPAPAPSAPAPEPAP